MKQIPNIFTLLNLIFGCLAIVCILQTGLTMTSDETGQNLVIIPERIYWAPFFIGCAALIDFLDGFVARLFKAVSEMGKQLDSLADVVSFGVAPGLIAYEFLRMSYAQQIDGLDISSLWLLPALLLPAAAAYRLARFNTDPAQGTIFRGVPVPAAALLIASLPLVYWYTSNRFILQLLINKWFWYAIILLVSYLMISTLPMLAPKFSGPGYKKMLPFLVLVLVAVSGAFILHWLTVPVTFIAYVILSLLFKPKKTS